MLVAVKQSNCCVTEQSVMENESNSGKPKSYLGYGNPEPSRKPLGFQACAETLRLASHVDEEKVRTLLKNRDSALDWHNDFNRCGCLTDTYNIDNH